MDAEAKRLKKRWLAEQKTAARALFPLSDGQLEELFAHVETAIASHGCDHTLCHTRHWLAERDFAVDPVVDWLGDNGGYCDCEVAANARGHFDENRS